MGNNRFTSADLLSKNLVFDEKQGAYVKNLKVIEPKFTTRMSIDRGHPDAYWRYMTLVDVFNFCENNGYIFIPGNVPSSKNSRRNFVTKSGKQLSLKSKSCTDYINNSSHYWKLFLPKFLKLIESKQKPLKINFTFVRDNKHAFDFINPCQTVQDIMVDRKWLNDDNMKEIIPSFSEYGYDKKLPGVIIKLL